MNNVAEDEKCWNGMKNIEKRNEKWGWTILNQGMKNVKTGDKIFQNEIIILKLNYTSVMVLVLGAVWCVYHTSVLG
jgi:hypothetical protein